MGCPAGPSDSRALEGETEWAGGVGRETGGAGEFDFVGTGVFSLVETLLPTEGTFCFSGEGVREEYLQTFQSLYDLLRLFLSWRS